MHKCIVKGMVEVQAVYYSAAKGAKGYSKCKCASDAVCSKMIEWEEFRTKLNGWNFEANLKVRPLWSVETLAL